MSVVMYPLSIEDRNGMIQIYSDFHKDAYGFRPRHINVSALSDEQLDEDFKTFVMVLMIIKRLLGGLLMVLMIGMLRQSYGVMDFYILIRVEILLRRLTRYVTTFFVRFTKGNKKGNRNIPFFTLQVNESIGCDGVYSSRYLGYLARTTLGTLQR